LQLIRSKGTGDGVNLRGDLPRGDGDDLRSRRRSRDDSDNLRSRRRSRSDGDDRRSRRRSRSDGDDGLHF